MERIPEKRKLNRFAMLVMLLLLSGLLLAGCGQASLTEAQTLLQSTVSEIGAQQTTQSVVSEARSQQTTVAAVEEMETEQLLESEVLEVLQNRR
jgi:uncharacterized lipoprotein YajG